MSTPHAAADAPRLARLEAELTRRVDERLRDAHLFVDYYRIRRRVAYELPVTSAPLLAMPMPMPGLGASGYPWPIWMTWALEERLDSLAWAADRGRADARDAAVRDIAALAAWPTYHQYPKPDLGMGHAGRALWAAHGRAWLPAATRQAVRAACARLVAQAMPLSDAIHGRFATVDDVLRTAEPHLQVHNIPLIGSIGAALCAHAINDPAQAVLDRRIAAVVGALLALRDRGVVEGVAYDGYVLDFVADWLAIRPAAERAAVLDHPQVERIAEESFLLGAPGDALRVAELGDVEPREMTFHATAQAKWLAFRPTRERRAWLGRLRLDWLRADALARLHADAAGGAAPAEPAGPIAAHASYAAVLRTGDGPGDLAVAMSATTSPMGHFPPDNGTIVIGAGGRWLIADPGYQQYLQNSERGFTTGPTAHNAPVVDGRAQEAKRPADVRVERAGGDLRASIDLTACYPAELGLASVRRRVWLRGRSLVVVADRVRGARGPLAWHWHGDPEAFWRVQEGAALVATPEAQLWIAARGIAFAEAMIDRPRGSRGHLALTVRADPGIGVAWWVFARAPRPPALGGAGARLTVGDEVFAFDDG